MAAVDESLSLPIVATPGRELAARALLGGADCSQQRASDLLNVSRRTIGRMADADLMTALRDPQGLEGARACLAETASRGSTAAEREAAVAWLQAAAREEHQVEVKRAVTKPSGSAVNRRPHRNGAHRNGSATAATETPGPPTAPLPPIDALRRQQQRILHCSEIGESVAAEKRGGALPTTGDALAVLFDVISEAARTIGTLLQTATGEPDRGRA